MWFEYANRSNSSSCLFVILQEVDLKSELLCRCQEFYWRPRLALLQKNLFLVPIVSPLLCSMGEGTDSAFFGTFVVLDRCVLGGQKERRASVVQQA